MGNSPTRHDSSASSFRENSKQYRDYRGLENKIRLLKIQANNYNGVGKDALYTEMFASVQDTIETVRYLRERSKNSNRKIEYDMLDAELKGCLQILSSKIHHNNESNAGGRPNKAPELQQHQQKSSGNNEQLQYALDSMETRIIQLKNNVVQLSGSHGNQNTFNQLESTGKSLLQDLENLVAPNNSKKLYLLDNLHAILNEITSKQADLYRKSKYDNLEASSEPTDPNLQLLLKMEKSLSVFRDREYLTSESRDVAKMVDTLNCYKNDLHNLRITSKDVNKKHIELLGFIDSTIKFLKENDNSSSKQKHVPETVVDSPQTRKEDPLMKNIQEELNKIQTSANQNSTNENYLKRIIDLLQQVNYSLQLKNQQPYHKSNEVISTREGDGSFSSNHQYRASTDDVRKVAAKSTLQTALERKGYRKTFLANTMIKQHAAKFKRSSDSSEVPDPDYSVIDDEPPQSSGHNNSFNMGSGGNQYNSLPKNGTTEYRGSPQQLTPNSARRQDNRSINKAKQEMEAIRRELDYLRNRVDNFNDSRQSALYEELETALLELLLRIENVQTDSGAMVATDVLVYTIRDTQKVLYILDDKALKYRHGY